MAEPGRASGVAGFVQAAGRIAPAWVLVLFAVLGVRSIALEPVHVPSESMLPTLRAGDRLLVDKLAFGAPVPFSDWRLPALREPGRGDVVVFEVARQGDRLAPVDARPGWPRVRFVKRIVGLPGDAVELHSDGALHVDGRRVDDWPTGELLLDAAGRPLHGKRARLDDREHGWVDDPTRALRPMRFRVQEGRYLVIGDNRDHSSDGRRFGTIHRSQLQGRVSRIVWSRAPGEPVRWSRIGRGVH